MLIMDTRKP